MEWILLFPLVPIIYHDFRHRSVLLWQLLLFGAMQIVVCFCKYGVVQMGYYMLCNLTLTAIIAVSVILYIHFRFGFKQQLLGKGDIIFILFLTPCFSSLYFLYFLIVSFLTALASWVVKSLFWRNNVDSVPLVSYLGICYVIVIFYNSLSGLCK